MVLSVEAGKSLYAIEREGGPKKNTVCKWVERFHRRRQKDPGRPVKGYLCDAEREGRLPEFPGEAALPQEALAHAVVSFDEKTGIQALERAALDRLMRPGRLALLEYEYQRHGTLCLLGLLHVNTGHINGLCLPQRTNQDTAMALRVLLGMLLMQGYKRVTVILEQLNTHMSLEVVKSVATLCDLQLPDDEDLDSRLKRRA